jgi:hypothetical protein
MWASVDDYSSCGSGVTACYPNQVNGGTSLFRGAINVLTEAASMTLGTGTANASTALVVNGGCSGDAAGSYISLRGGGSDQTFIGAPSAIFSGA